MDALVYIIINVIYKNIHHHHHDAHDGDVTCDVYWDWNLAHYTNAIQLAS